MVFRYIRCVLIAGLAFGGFYKGSRPSDHGCLIHFYSDLNCALHDVQIESPKDKNGRTKYYCGIFMKFELDITTVCN